MTQPDLFTSWVCHARPARLGGRCGHLNPGRQVRADRGEMDTCEACGCTRKASEDRERKR